MDKGAALLAAGGVAAVGAAETVAQPPHYCTCAAHGYVNVGPPALQDGLHPNTMPLVNFVLLGVLIFAFWRQGRRHKRDLGKG